MFLAADYDLMIDNLRKIDKWWTEPTYWLVPAETSAEDLFFQVDYSTYRDELASTEAHWWERQKP